MTGHGAKFGRKKEDAIAALLTQRNVDEAARQVGIDVKTLLRWMKIPEFETAYRDARRIAFGQSIARLQQGTSAAATTLLKMLIDPSTPPAVRVRVADSIMKNAIRAIEVEDIEVRIAELERAAESSRAAK